VITGYNTDVKREGRVFHVQTEDKGLSNPVIESLIYAGGKILASRQYSYAWHVREGYEERVVQELLDCQHRKMMRDIHGGKYDPEGPPPFGAGIITERGFDDLVLEFLRSQRASGGLEIAVANPGEIRPGDLVVLHVTLRVEGGAGEQGARLVIRAVLPDENGTRSVTLYQGVADREGKVRAGFEVPRDAWGGTLVLEGTGRAGAAETAFRIVS
jgi:hypothetical protein